MAKAAKYTFEASWGSGTSERCSQIDILVINSEIDQETVVNDISIIIPGFPEDVKPVNQEVVVLLLQLGGIVEVVVVI